MSSWDYVNIGAWTAPENRKHVKKIFEYIGYAPKPDFAQDGERHGFDDPDVYGCMKTDSYLSSQINIKEPFQTYSPSLAAVYLLNLLNALFPGTKVCIHTASGSDTDDISETMDEIYNTDDMMCYKRGSAGRVKWGPVPRESFTLELPELEWVQALTDISKEDENSELTEMLTELIQKIKCDLDSPEFQADIIGFGHYPQAASGDDKTPIDWFVLDKSDSKALVISRYELDAMEYYPKTSSTWKGSSLRAWLNNTFLNSAFTAKEQAAIITTEIVTLYHSPKGDIEEHTKDKVFLLSLTEVEKYMDTDAARKCAATDYALEQGVYSDECTVGGHLTGLWWLRSPGESKKYAAAVHVDGTLASLYVSDRSISVRPALWLNLDSDVFKK